MTPPDPASRTSRRLALAGAVLLGAVGVLLLIAVTYAPGLLGLEDPLAAGAALGLRALGLLALLGASAVVVRTRHKE